MLHICQLLKSLAMAHTLTALLQVALVVVLSGIEGSRWHDLSDDWPSELRLPAFFRSTGSRFLLRRMKEHGRAILCSVIGTLPVQRSGIVKAPELIQKLIIGNFGRIKSDLNGLGVASAVGAHVAVGWVGERAAGVADARISYAGNLAER